MKKRMMAILCVLTVLLGILAATAAAADTTDKIEVGYAKKDINPWVDVKDHSKGVMAVPLAGYNNPHTRLAQGRIDDNGDGDVTDEDGLFATCVAVKDSDNKLLIFISFDVTQVQDDTVTEVRNRIITELSDEYTLTPEQIMLSASHSHYTPNIVYASSTYVNNGNITEETRALMETYKEYLYSQLTLAATDAVADLNEVSKISKSTTDAGEVTGYYMNGVRHYNVTAKYLWNTVNYQAGDNFGSLYNAGTTYGDSHPTMAGYTINSVTHVTQANDQMHLLKFAFSDGSDPVVIANWRAHTTLNRKYEGEAGVVLNPGVDRDALLDEGNGIGYYCVSSSYVNAFRYQLECMNLRVSFIQGAAGNINPDSRASNLNGWIENGWEVAMAEKAGYDTTNSSGYASNAHMDLYRKAVIIGNVYGELLSQVAEVGLQDSNMTECEPGKIQTMQVRYALDPNVFEGEMPGLQYAAEAYQAESSPSTPYVYTYNGQKYIINSPQHARTVVNRAKDLAAGSFAETLAKLELNAIMIGPDLAFVSAPNELYDFYDAACSTSASENDWLDIESDIIGGTYGTPFVMCYTNGNHSYVANSAAFEYNAGSTRFGKGSYGANSSEVAKGGGEAIIAAYGKMLTALNDGTSIKTETCKHCDEVVEWKPLLAENAGNTNLYHDHYYLAEDIDSQRAREKMILAGQSICLDLNGHTFCSNDAAYGRAFYIYEGAELTIMDSQGGGKVVAGGRKSTAAAAGGVIGVLGYADTELASGVLNLYGGTVERTVTEGQSATYGGAIFCSGVINMFGGNVIGGDTTEKGGAIHCNGNGEFYMHNGCVEGGNSGGTTPNAVNMTNNFNMTGGTIVGGVTLGGSSNYISGSAVIDGSEGLNLQIPSGKTINVGELTSDARIRVTADGIFTDANGASENNAQYFVGDTGCYVSPTPDGMFAGDKGYCECGGTQPTGHTCKTIAWKEWTATATLPTTSGNYYLTSNVTTVKQTWLKEGSFVRLDLNGKDVTYQLPTYANTENASGGKATRVFHLYRQSDLVLTDSTANPGTISRDTSNWTDTEIATISNWGLLVILAGQEDGNSAVAMPTSFTMYNGILDGSDSVTTGSGIVAVYNAESTFKMYGGEIIGGTAVGGGAVMNCGTTELYGGTIAGGTATSSNYGHCVHVADTATLKLAGDAEVEEIYFAASDCSDDLTITGKYVGTAALKYRNGVNKGMTIGISDSADLSEATLQCVNNSSLYVTVSGNVLKLTFGSQEVVAILYVDGLETEYANLQEAINACTDGSVVSLVKSGTDSISIPAGKTVSLDLNSFDLGDVVVDGTFLVKDSATDSFDTAEGAFGKITGDISGSGTIQGAPLDSDGRVYVKVEENDGISFHCLKMQIGSAGIYYNNPGMKYICDFKGDRWAAAQVVTYGVAVSVTDEPTQQNGEFASHCAATSQTGFASGPSGNSGNSSTVTGILKDSYSYQVNRNNANLVIYGKSYVKLSDGTCLLGAPVNYSFRDLFEYASDGVDAQGNSIWDTYFTDTDKSNLIKIYDDFAYIMEDWTIEKLVAESNA